MDADNSTLDDFGNAAYRVGVLDAIRCLIVDTNGDPMKIRRAIIDITQNSQFETVAYGALRQYLDSIA